MTDTVRLEALMLESGLKRAYIAESLGISENSLRNKVANRTEFKPSEINKICKLLGIKTMTDRQAIFFAK